MATEDEYADVLQLMVLVMVMVLSLDVLCVTRVSLEDDLGRNSSGVIIFLNLWKMMLRYTYKWVLLS